MHRRRVGPAVVPDALTTAVADRPLTLPSADWAEGKAGLARAAAGTACYHCGTPCGSGACTRGDKAFCCHGCLTVYELLSENGLDHFYDLGQRAGNRIGPPGADERFRYLDDPVVRDRLLDFADDTTSRVTFQIPAIHCVACVWLLENLFRLKPGLGRSVVNFPRREVSITFEHGNVRLSEVVALLASLGYEPAFNLSTPEPRRVDPQARRLWLRAGVAGFAFGNIMLLSIPGYFGMETAGQPALKAFFGYVSLGLALPVLLFSASDYWRAARLAWSRRWLTIDLPIALGLVALFGQSAFDVLTGRGPGYCDSLAGLVFFLLCGKLFQHKTYDRLTFDRDYKSFFPLAVVRRTASGDETVPLARIAVGDRLVLRSRELVPADARLTAGQGLIDYSFVTGEAEPVARAVGDHLYAGGQQVGGSIEAEVVKPVSQSYLTALWGHEAFAKERTDTLDNLTNRFSRRFTIGVVVIACLAATFWTLSGDPARAVQSFVAVLIVACPCALALAAPFALGTAQRLLARRHVFLKNPQVVETLARIDTVVFDKTGTLTTARAAEVRFEGRPLTIAEQAAVAAVARHSTHPYATRLGTLATAEAARPAPVEAFRETPGSGLEARVGGRELCLGSAAWLAARGVSVPADPSGGGSRVHLAVAGTYRGRFRLSSALRPETGTMLAQLAAGHDLALLSGDGEGERDRFRSLFPPGTRLLFNQSPARKLDFVRDLQRAGRTVMMVGDGLNDAGALRQADAGVAVVERVGVFSPASDVILEATVVPRLHDLLKFSRRAVRIVGLSFWVSSLYNAVGLSLAAGGLLSPLICAVLMPLSSVTVVAFASGATRWVARRADLAGDESEAGA